MTEASEMHSSKMYKDFESNDATNNTYRLCKSCILLQKLNYTIGKLQNKTKHIQLGIKRKVTLAHNGSALRIYMSYWLNTMNQHITLRGNLIAEL